MNLSYIILTSLHSFSEYLAILLLFIHSFLCYFPVQLAQCRESCCAALIAFLSPKKTLFESRMFAHIFSDSRQLLLQWCATFFLIAPFLGILIERYNAGKSCPNNEALKLSFFVGFNIRIRIYSLVLCTLHIVKTYIYKRTFTNREVFLANEWGSFTSAQMLSTRND